MTYTAVDVDRTTRHGRAVIRDFIRETAEDRAHDPWGSGMLALGAIVDNLWEAGEGVPSAIATPGAFTEIDPEDFHAVELRALLNAGQVTTDDIRYGMFVIDRYLSLARRAGRDY